MRISVIIPTYQAQKNLHRLLTSLNAQSLPPDEVIVIDSSSTDETILIAMREKCKVITINKDDFRHGKARNLGVDASSGDLIVFLTQDVNPADNNFLEELTRPILQGAAATTARQIPYPSANPVEEYSRQYNYPEVSKLRSQVDMDDFGIRAYFFSNSASAIDRKIFQLIGGFSENVIVNEDMELCARLISKGFTVVYQATAKVYHSHNYSFVQLFNRYFDIGVFFTQANSEIRAIKPSGEGFKFARRGFVTLANQNTWYWIPRFIVDVGIKYLAFSFGKQNELLPIWLKRKFSAQRQYWI